VKLVVLGAGAGGGFPQWNSNADNCRRARSADPAALPRTQTGLAVSLDGNRWFLLNASPDLRQQLERTPALHPDPGGPLRSSPIAGVVLTGGDVDVIAGLLTLRERHPFVLHATSRIHAVLDANPIFEVLSRQLVERRVQALDRPFVLEPGLTAELFAVPGKVPLYLEQAGTVPELQADETTVGLLLSDGAHRVFFVPGCAAVDDGLRRRLEGGDLVLFDGTLWRDDEMIAAGLGPKTGQRMGHISLDGPDGTIEAFSGIRVGRKVIVHMNNSNPVLLADSPQRARAQAAGWTVGFDGMEIEL
jgi:pyrroloquinoline quinone biosynthesis protein B